MNTTATMKIHNLNSIYIQRNDLKLGFECGERTRSLDEKPNRRGAEDAEKSFVVLNALFLRFFSANSARPPDYRRTNRRSGGRLCGEIFFWGVFICNSSVVSRKFLDEVFGCRGSLDNAGEEGWDIFNLLAIQGT